MSSKLIFAKRSSEDIRIFGGQVFADIDGKNVATIEQETITLEISAGIHQIKMYKSHEYGSMIGFAETEINLKDGETLVLKYSPPLVVTQPGHIVVSDFISYDHLNSEINASAQIIAQEKRENDRKIRQQEEEVKRNSWWWIIFIFVIPAICWLIYELTWMSIWM